MTRSYNLTMPRIKGIPHNVRLILRYREGIDPVPAWTDNRHWPWNKRTQQAHSPRRRLMIRKKPSGTSSENIS